MTIVNWFLTLKLCRKYFNFCKRSIEKYAEFNCLLALGKLCCLLFTKPVNEKFCNSKRKFVKKQKRSMRVLTFKRGDVWYYDTFFGMTHLNSLEWMALSLHEVRQKQDLRPSGPYRNDSIFFVFKRQDVFDNFRFFDSKLFES